MSVFKDYSKYYNLLYQGKDYRAEANYVLELIKKYRPDGHSILNLGCGTGNHDFIFSEKGFDVTGIDLSQDMINIANGKKTNQENLHFVQSDIRYASLGKKFDAVISLFHVMSYQTTNKDMQDALKTAHDHLEKDGLLVFDCWYGPGVLTDRPTIRNKTLEDENYLVTRLSTPKMYPNDNCVDVEFNVTITEKKTQEHYKIDEVHKMRYLFLPEIKFFVEAAGFKLLLSEEWLSSKELTFDSWNATIVCRKG